MAIELKVPTVGESITEAMIGEWLKEEGDQVDADEPLVVIETDKVNVELPAPEAGTLSKILKKDGDDVEIGEVIGYLEPGKSDSGDSEASAQDEAQADGGDEGDADGADASSDAGEPEAATETDVAEPSGDGETGEPQVTPAARRLLAEHALDPSVVEATGFGGRILKEDVLRHVEGLTGDGAASAEATGAAAKPQGDAEDDAKTTSPPSVEPPPSAGARHEEAVKMTPLRRRVAQRLVEAQQEAALLTTFNEIDMSQVIALRKTYQESFVAKYDIKLGFMSFFVKAAVEALKQVPQVNAEVRGDHIVYRNYQDVGVAVGGGKGLVVPVVRNAERLSFAEVEQTIANLARRAKNGKLKLEELQGGTFTISNGGIYGSLLSTPIVNPPQSGILGLHKIEERPVAVAGEVVVRPMMYVALTYDHRLVDGREAVTFLVKIKERIEDPTRILLEV